MWTACCKILEAKNVSGHLFLSMTHQKVLQALRQADYLSPKYHVVIANPPYMGGKGMNGRLGAWLKDNYADAKIRSILIIYGSRHRDGNVRRLCWHDDTL